MCKTGNFYSPQNKPEIVPLIAVDQNVYVSQGVTDDVRKNFSKNWIEIEYDTDGVLIFNGTYAKD